MPKFINSSGEHKNIIKLLQHSYFAWLLYFIVFNIYCIFWRQYLMTEQYDFIDSLLWWFKEWGIWLVLTPLTIIGLDYLCKLLPVTSSAMLLAVIIVTLAICCRQLIALPLESQDIIAHAIAMLPKYSITYTLIVAVWFFSCHQKTIVAVDACQNTLLSEPQVNSATSNDDINTASSDNLEAICELKSRTSDGQALNVEHLGLALDIKFTDIYAIKASGNYVDICCQTEQYVKRTTLKELLQMLPTTDFMQVHRSYIVNLAKIQKLTNSETGAGILTLTNNQNINVSKKFKGDVKLAVHNNLK